MFNSEEVTIVSTPSQFDELLKAEEIEEDFTFGAKKFKNSHPQLIVVLSSLEGQPVLHKKLGIIPGKAGEYNEGENAPYCLSDFLADAQYDFVVVDDLEHGLYLSFSGCCLYYNITCFLNL